MIDIEIINTINNQINSRSKLPELLTSILDLAKELLESEGSSILLTDIKTGDLVFNTVTGDKKTVISGQRIPKGKGIAGEVALKGKPIIVNDVSKDKRFFNEIDKKTSFITRNIIAVPMVIQNDLVGVLEIVNTIDRATFSDADLKKAMLLAVQAAIAIDSRNTQDSLNRRIDELSALYEVSQTISSQKYYDENIFNHILKNLSHLVGAEKSSIFIENNQTKKLNLISSFGLPKEIENGYEINAEKSIASIVYNSGDPLIVSDINEEVPQDIISNTDHYKTKSFISLPIVNKSEVIGVLNMADKKSNNNFDSFDLRVLSPVCNIIAETFANIENDKMRIEQKLLEKEINIAAEIQKKILPTIPDSFQIHKLAAFNEPAKYVGGDFYDFFQYDDHKYGVVVADVSGKGIPAAIFMGLARNIFRAETRLHQLPRKLLFESNNHICADSEHGMYVTLCYYLIDTHNNILTYGSAGHNNQLLIKKAGKLKRMNATGKPLGVLEDLEYEEKVTPFEKGDMLLLFTDGVVEFLGGSNLDITVGEKKLAKIAYKHIKKEPEDLIKYLKNMYHQQSERPELKDDFTIFAIKF